MSDDEKEISSGIDDVPVDERDGAEFIDAYSTTEDSPTGAGLSVELWQWESHYFLRMIRERPDLGIIAGYRYEDWEDLGEVPLKEAMDLLGAAFSELVEDEDEDE